MHRRFRHLRLRHVLGLALVTLLLGASVGCASSPAPRSQVLATDQGPGGKPHANATWVKGHYRYLDGRYVWVPGHWRR